MAEKTNIPRVYQRKGSPYWWLSWYGPSGRMQVSTKLDTHDIPQAEAERIGLSMLRNLTEPKPEGKTVGWLRDFTMSRLEVEGKAESTKTNYELAFRCLVEQYGEGYIIEPISRSFAVDFQSYLHKRGLRPGTINIYGSFIAASFARAISAEHLQKNPFTLIRRIQNTENTEQKHLTKEEAEQFLVYLDTNVKRDLIRHLIRIYLFTGRRRNEILGIERKDIDIISGVMMVKNIKRKLKPKTPIRIVEQIRGDVAWFLEQTNNQYPFALIKPSALTDYVKRVLINAGHGNLHLHSLRHSFGSLAAVNGADVLSIKRQMDHSSVTTTEHYLHEVRESSIDIGIK